MEIQDLDITVSEDMLVNLIKNNKEFLDEKGFFSRTKYEKFLLLQNITAIQFEEKLKENELKKRLFSYVSGGIKSPLFVINNVYQEQTSKIDVEFINLDKIYKKKEDFTVSEINEYIKLNNNNLEEEYIDFTYAKLTPKNLIGIDNFNELFFKKIDEIENKISNEVKFNEIITDLKIQVTKKKEFKPSNTINIIEDKIYSNRNENKVQLIDQNEFYLLFKIDSINKTLPTIDNKKFVDKIKSLLFDEYKNDFNRKIFDKIVNKKFSITDFKNLAETNSLNINQIQLSSIKDNKKFEINSVKLLYTQAINSLVMISDKKNNIYLAKIKNITKDNISKKSEKFLNYNNQANMKIRDTMYQSYDYYIAEKYKVIINEKTLERVKNYFK